MCPPGGREKREGRIIPLPHAGVNLFDPGSPFPIGDCRVVGRARDDASGQADLGALLAVFGRSSPWEEARLFRSAAGAATMFRTKRC